jgi:hypothetical protein
MKRLNRRGFLSYAAAFTAVPQILCGGVASQHFVDWLQCKTDIRRFLRAYFKVPGPDGAPRPYQPNHWLNILADDQDNNHYLLKVSPQSSPQTAAAIATHRLVFGSQISIMLGGNLAASRNVFETVEFALRQLPPWMLAHIEPDGDGALTLPGGNRLALRPGVRPCSDLLITDADLVPRRDLERAVAAAAAGYARVVMTTSKSSYRSPVPCITLTDASLNSFMGAFDN